MISMKPIRPVSILLVLALLITAASCSRKGTKAAERGVETFHTQFNQERYKEIYTEASDEFHKAASEQDLVNLLSTIRSKLGTVKSSTLKEWNVNNSTDGTMIILTYETLFEQGTAKERFAWRETGEQTKLLRYDIKPSDQVAK